MASLKVMLNHILKEYISVDQNEINRGRTIRSYLKSYFDFLKNTLVIAGLKYASIKSNSGLIGVVYALSLTVLTLQLQTIHFGYYVFAFGKGRGKLRLVASTALATLFVMGAIFYGNRLMIRLVSKFAIVQAIR